MGLWACENRTRRAVQQAPLSRLLLIATILLLAGKAAPQHASKPNRRCGEIFDQAVDEETLRNLFKSSVMSAMSYLEYEKDSAVHPWSVDFESTSPKTRLGSLRISIRMYICQARSLVSRMFNSILKSLYSLPLLRYLLRRRETKGAINLNDAEKSVDGKNSQSQLSKTDSCQVEENAWESFKFRWFFADWREGLWHDTEVLLGESATTAVIIFRGSDTAADLFTNSQTMEPALHSYYFGSQAGSLHRGMLNAYGRVDKGKLIKLDRGDDSKSAFGPVIGQTFDHFKKLQNVTNHQKELNSSRSQQSAGSKRHSDKYSNSKIGSNNINENSTSTSNDDSDRKTGTTTDSRPSTSGLNNASNKKNKSSDPTLTSNSTHITDTLLSNLLINSVLSALRSGHSLGGSLALLLALDITVNHIEEVDGIDRETEVEQTKIKEKNNKEKSTMGSGDNHTKSKGKKEVVVERVGKVTTDTKSEQDELRDDYDSRKCGSYSHHRGRRCTGFAHPSILDNLSVMTFGQPELADLTFFESVSARSSAAESLLNQRYFRCIGLSRGPNCDADIITRLVSKVGNIIGDWLAGKGTRSRQSKENTKEKGKSEVLSATVINGNSVKHSKTSKNGGSKEITEKRREHDDNHIGSNSNSISNEDIGNDSRSDKLLSSNDKNKNKINKKSTQEVDVEKARKRNVQEEDGIDVVINSGIISKKKLEKKTVKKTEKRVLNRILNKTESHLNKQKDALFNLHGIEGNSSSHEQSGKSKKGDGIESHPGSTVRDKTESRGKGNNRNKEIKPDEKNNEEERESTNHGAGRIIFICSGLSKDSIEAHRMNHYVQGIQMMGSTYNRKTKTADVTERKVQRPRGGRGNKGRTVDPGTESEDTRDDEESKKGKTDRTDKKKVKERVSQDSRDSGSRKSKILSVRAGSTAARTDINKSSKSYHSSIENINLDLDLDPSSNITDTNFATNTINNQKSRNSRQKKSTIDEKDSDRSDKGKEEKERTDDSSNNDDHRNHDTNKDKELQSEKVQKKSEAFQVGISLKSNLRLDSALNLNLISAERFNLFHDKKDENRDKKIDIDNEFYSFY